MGFVFRKSIKIANGLRLNVSKSGVSLTAGKKGMHYTINSKGKSTASIGIPGTGLSYRKSFDVFGGLSKLFGGGEEGKETTTKQVKAKEVKQVEQTTTNNVGIEPLPTEDGKVNISGQAQATSAPDPEQEKYDDYMEYIDKIRGFHKSVSKVIDWSALANANVPDNASEQDKLEWQSTIALAKDVTNKDIDSYLKVIKEYSPFEDISAFGSDFEFGSDDADSMTAHFLVKIKDVVPSVGFKKSETGKITDFELKGTAYNDIAQDYVCSCAIRIARELFALLPIDFVIVNAEDSVFDSSTGNNTDATIMSVLFVKEGFDNINFDKIDPSDFVGRFKSNMDFSKTNGFKQVKEIEMPK